VNLLKFYWVTNCVINFSHTLFLYQSPTTLF